MEKLFNFLLKENIVNCKENDQNLLNSSKKDSSDKVVFYDE